jgi:hypothetical protein
MRNLAIASNAAFQATERWTKRDLPITLPWRSSLWRYIVPVAWLLGLLLLIGMFNMQTPYWGATLYALLFIALPGLLAGSGAWWVAQWRNRRNAASFVIHDDYLEWQFEDVSDVDQFADCGRFALAGQRGYDARIEWDSAARGEAATDDWLEGAKAWLLSRWRKCDRALYARDLGLDRGELESLCGLLNQLRDAAAALR